MVKVKIIQEGLQHNVGEIINVSDYHATELIELKHAEPFKKLVELNDKRSIVKNFIKLQPIFYDRGKNWWIWDFDNLKWKLIDEIDILNSLKDHTNFNTINSTEKNELLEALKQEGRLNQPKDISQYWVQFKEKIIDIINDKEIIPSSKFFITNPIPYSIGDSDNTPIMDKIFEEWVGKNNVKLLYEIIAYCCLPSYPINRLFCLVGSGMNGKSKFLELIKNFLGVENVTTTELDFLLQSRFEITKLHKKLVCIMGETNFNELKNTSILKKLTGGDLIGFEHKNKEPFEDINYAKIIIATNNLPTTNDKTIGFYRRWLIIDFPNSFSEKKDILLDIPQSEYNNLTNKCIRILKELLLKREFTNEGTIEERQKRFEDRSNPLDKFIKEMTEEDPDGDIPCWKFIKEINEWAKSNKFRQMTENIIGLKMKEHGFIVQKLTKEIWNKDLNTYEFKRVKCYTGLKWKNDTDVTDVTYSSTQFPYVKLTEGNGDIRDICSIEDEICSKCGKYHKNTIDCQKLLKKIEEEIIYD